MSVCHQQSGGLICTGLGDLEELVTKGCSKAMGSQIAEMGIVRVDNNFRWSRCPLCHSDSIRKLGCADYGGRLIFSSQEIELSSQPEVWACHQCSSGFVQNIIPKETAASIYKRACSAERWPNVSFQREKTSEVVRIMSELFAGKGRVLDVGCNTGELLDYAAQFGCETSGVEYSDDSREVMRHKGHMPYQTLMEVPGQFEIITAFDLIEHLYDVPTFLNHCHSRLVAGGKLIVLTGDIQSASAKAAGAHWWYAQYPEHIVFPSRLFFENLQTFKLDGWFPTYAAAAYDFPFYRIVLSHVKRVSLLRRYNGLPSWSPDHALIVLTKVNG